jgi:hypothetical protein
VSILIKDGNAPKDKRDYIVAEHEVEIGDVQLTVDPDEVADTLGYNPDQQYDIALVQDTNDMTGEVKYYWIVEKNNKRLSPDSKSSQQATNWMREATIRHQVMMSK